MITIVSRWFRFCQYVATMFSTSTTKKLKDDKEKGGENKITDHFLATAEYEAIMNIPQTWKTWLLKK